MLSFPTTNSTSIGFEIHKAKNMLSQKKNLEFFQ